jgi:dihydrofolate reductase
MKVVLLMAMTVDGLIAKNADHPANWTSKADKKIFVEETKKAGVIIMGEKTYNTIGRPLPGRLNIVLTRKPDKNKNIPDSLEFTSEQPREILSRLENTKRFDTVILGGGATANGMFLKDNLIDELLLTVEPKLFGSGLPLFRGVETDLDLKLTDVKKIDDDVIQLRYRLNK